MLGAQTYGAAAVSRRPGAGRRCGSSSRPWCAGRCGISPAGLQGGGERHWGTGPGPQVGGGGGSQSVLTVADDPSQGLALEVELHVHVLALRDGAGVRAGDPAESGSPAPAPPDPAPRHPLPGHSRSGRSCRCGWFWHFRRLRKEDREMQQWSWGGVGEAEPSPRGGRRVRGAYPPARGWTAAAAPSPCPPPPLCCRRPPRRTSPACWPLQARGRWHQDRARPSRCPLAAPQDPVGCPAPTCLASPAFTSDEDALVPVPVPQGAVGIIGDGIAGGEQGSEGGWRAPRGLQGVLRTRAVAVGPP